VTPSGIEPATFRFVAQYLNHCATAVPIASGIAEKVPESFSIQMLDYLGPYFEVELSRMLCRNGRPLTKCQVISLTQKHLSLCWVNIFGTLNDLDTMHRIWNLQTYTSSGAKINFATFLRSAGFFEVTSLQTCWEKRLVLAYATSCKKKTQCVLFILFTHQQIHYLLNLESFKIYTKIHTNIAATCFVLRPSSWSLY
jgi:hypothetical protein